MNLSTSMYIGDQLSGNVYPVFFDTHYPLLNNNPPGILVTGSPGSGKTWLLLLLASHSALLGKTNVIIDPKGDFLALKKLEQNNILENIHVWNLAPKTSLDKEESEKELLKMAEENNGVLDPMTFYDNPDENVALAKSVITSLTGGSLTSVQSNHLIPILKDVVRLENPTFPQVVSYLRRSKIEEVRNLGIELDALSGLSLSKLLFTDKRKEKKSSVDLKNKTTIINLMGLSLPAETSNPNTWKENEKISLAIMSLITNLVTESFFKIPKSTYKTLYIDEAWTVFNSQTGKDMINKISLKGRSLNIAIVLATQSPKHIEGKDGIDISNTISVRFAFRNSSKEDNLITTSAMNLPSNEGWEEICLYLETGQCLLNDSSKDTGVISISVPIVWQNMFNTNPLAEISSN